MCLYEQKRARKWPNDGRSSSLAALTFLSASSGFSPSFDLLLPSCAPPPLSPFFSPPRHRHTQIHKISDWKRSASSSSRPRSSARAAGKSRRRRCRRRSQLFATAAARSDPRRTVYLPTSRRRLSCSVALYIFTICRRRRARTRGPCAPRRRGTAASRVSSSTAAVAAAARAVLPLPLPPRRRSRGRLGRVGPCTRPS